MTASRPVIVAGYDGSVASRAAVEAGIERVASGGHLVIVHAYSVPADYIGASYYQDMLDTKLERANAIMNELIETCPGLNDVDWESDAVVGNAGEVVNRVAQARNADEIVIGTRGHGRFRAALGSTALDVLHGAMCPVLIIPERVAEARRHLAGAGRAAI